jgi:hypothetical protein
MAANPVFTVPTNAIAMANVSAANTARDGTGTIVTLVTAATAGTQVAGITFQATATTAAAQMLVWLSSDSGTTWRLLDEQTVTAVTPSTTARAFNARWTPPGGVLTLPSSTWRLGVTSTVAQSVNCIAHGVGGGDLT